MTRPTLPPSATVADPLGDGRLHLPAAERNAGPISDLVAEVMAEMRGMALEIASGSGQHVVRHAARLPGLTWQPTDIEDRRLRSIDSWVATAGLGNVRPAITLDATRPGWSADHGGQSLVLLVNLLHLIPAPDASILLGEVARALAPGGRFILYGPFMRDGELTSGGDRRFHAELIAADPRIGYRDAAEIRAELAAAGLSPIDLRDMPANNLAFVGTRPA